MQATRPRVDLRINFENIRHRISAAAVRCGRNPAEITLVAAAKKKNAEMIEAALAAGVTDIGENYVQEAFEKRRAVRSKARWHLIGHLQRNKAARAIEIFDMIQTVDHLGLATALN